ncbi:MAG: hypothetical protein K5644_02220 [Lachnospiraceae bacterium]|nr:hypothetical protein [Lachnospiraceae bacterium]
MSNYEKIRSMTVDEMSDFFKNLGSVGVIDYFNNSYCNQLQYMKDVLHGE